MGISPYKVSAAGHWEAREGADKTAFALVEAALDAIDAVTEPVED